MAQYQPTPEEQRWLDQTDTEFTTYDLFLADRGGEIAVDLDSTLVELARPASVGFCKDIPQAVLAATLGALFLFGMGFSGAFVADQLQSGEGITLNSEIPNLYIHDNGASVPFTQANAERIGLSRYDVASAKCSLQASVRRNAARSYGATADFSMRECVTDYLR